MSKGIEAYSDGIIDRLTLPLNTWMAFERLIALGNAYNSCQTNAWTIRWQWSWKGRVMCETYCAFSYRMSWWRKTSLDQPLSNLQGILTFSDIFSWNLQRNFFRMSKVHKKLNVNMRDYNQDPVIGTKLFWVYKNKSITWGYSLACYIAINDENQI